MEKHFHTDLVTKLTNEMNYIGHASHRPVSTRWPTQFSQVGSGLGHALHNATLKQPTATTARSDL